MEQTSGAKRKKIWFLLFILLNVAAIGATAAVDFGSSKPEHLPPINARYLLAVVGCFAALMGAETLRYTMLLKHFTGKRDPRMAYEVAALGKYYDYITPFGAGGQPFQGIYLNRNGVDVGSAAAIPVTGYLTYNGAFLIIAIFIFVFVGNFLGYAAVRVPVIVGTVVYAATPMLVVFFLISPGITSKVIGWGMRFLGKIRLLKNPEERFDKLVTNLYAIRDSMRSVFSERGLFIRLLLLGIVAQGALCSMPFFVLQTFGSNLSFTEVFCSCVFIYLGITFVPTPGNAGAAEGSFYAIFAVLGQNYIFWAMLIWRFFCYYAFIAQGLVVVWITSRRRKHAVKDPQPDIIIDVDDSGPEE